jgi:hypothetical protein
MVAPVRLRYQTGTLSSAVTVEAWPKTVKVLVSRPCQVWETSCGGDFVRLAS